MGEEEGRCPVTAPAFGRAARYPNLERQILAILEEKGEVHPPPSALAREYFWQAAASLKGQGLVAVDQIAGVVRRPVPVPTLQALRSQFPTGDGYLETWKATIAQLKKILGAEPLPKDAFSAQLEQVPFVNPLSDAQCSLAASGWKLERMEGTAALMEAPGGVHMWVTAGGRKSFGRPA